MKITGFVVYGTDGRIVRTGRCFAHDVALQAQRGEQVLAVTDPVDDVRDGVIDGELRRGLFEPPAAPERGPTEQEQLNAIWDALGSLPTLPDAARNMLEKIKTIKSEIPKS